MPSANPQPTVPILVTGYPLSTYANIRVRIRGLEMLVFRNILRTYLMDDSYLYFKVSGISLVVREQQISPVVR